MFGVEWSPERPREITEMGWPVEIFFSEAEGSPLSF